MDEKSKKIKERLENLGSMLRNEESMVGDVMERINAFPSEKKSVCRKHEKVLNVWPWWRKLIAVSALAAVALFSIHSFGDGMVQAAEVLSKAAKAAANLQSVFMQAQMRTLPRDNFELIGTEYEFVPIKMWKVFDGSSNSPWRVEKPGRVVVMDGQQSTLWIRPKSAARGGRNSGFVVFLKRILDVHLVIDEAVMLSQRKGSQSKVFEETDKSGKKRLVVVVDVPALGDFSQNAYLKNTSIVESDTQRIFRFDAKTLFLEELEIYVKTKNEKTLVFAIESVHCNKAIESAMFNLNLPSDVAWSKAAEAMPGTKYQTMGPREVARAIFTASANEDWNEFLKFYPRDSLSDGLKKKMARVKLLSLGEPFQSGLYSGWFVPYEIELSSGHVIKHNLAVRNDNKAKRYIFDGGL